MILNKGQKAIIVLLGDHPDQSFNALTIAKNTHLSESSVRTYLSDLIKSRKIIKESRGFYKGIKKYRKSLMEFLNEGINNPNYSNFFKDIVSYGYALGTHYFTCDLVDDHIRYFYTKCNWSISNSKNQMKSYIIIDQFGKTQIGVYSGKKTGNPKIKIIYDGKDHKKCLTPSNYHEWEQGINVFLKHTIGLNKKLDDFTQKQAEYNFDEVISKNNTYLMNKRTELRNIRMKHMKTIFELYDYEDEEGNLVRRRGVRIVADKDNDNGIPKDLKHSDPFMHFLMSNEANTEQLNYVLNNLGRLEIVEKQLKTIINNNNIVVDVSKEMIKSFSDNVEDIRKDFKSFEASLNTNMDSGMKNYQIFMETEIDSIRYAEKEFQTDLINISDKIDTHNTEYKAIFESLEKILKKNVSSLDQSHQNQTDLITVFKEFKKENNTINTTLTTIMEIQQDKQISQDEKIDKLVDTVNKLSNAILTLTDLEKEKQLKKIQREKNKSKLRRFVDRLLK